MADNLELKVIFTAVDKFVRPVNAIADGARTASRELKNARTAMKALSDQQKLIDSFRSTNKALGIDTRKLEEARGTVARLAGEMAATNAPTVALQRAFAEAKKEAAQLSANVNRLAESKQRLRTQLGAAGTDTKQLSAAQRDLKGKIDHATAAVNAQSTALETANRRMQRLKAAQAELAKTQQRVGQVRSAGAGLLAGGVAVGLPAVATTKAYAEFETAMLGVARQVDGARNANGRYTATYYEMGKAIQAMSERLPMAANDIALIVAGAARMGIQGKDDLLKFAETAAVMASAFDIPAEKIGEDMGKIANLYKIPIANIRELGDTINWLDDNAQSKGGDIIDVMQRISGIVTTAKMSYKEAAALGSTFLSLGAAPEVAASASQAMIRELSVATMQSKRFRAGAAMLNLDLTELQKTASTSPTATILKVMEAINRLPEEKRIEAATRLFGKEYGDDAAKLASNLAEYRKQLALVNDERARGSMQRESDAVNDSVNARMAMAKHALGNLATDLGESMRPALVDTLERTLAIAQAVRAWSAENPQLAAGLMTVVKWLAIGLTVLGGLALAAATVLGPFAMARFAFTALGISGVTMTGVLAGGFNFVMKGIGLFGNALLWIGRLALAHPILALITALAAGALYVWQNWDTLGPKFFALIDKISNYFGGLKDRALEAGRNMIDGMIGGITSRWEALKTTVTGIGDKSIDWIRDKLDMHSPSRVFAELGGYVMQGFELGLANGEDGPLAALGSLSKRLAAIGAGVVISGTAAAGTAAPAGGALGPIVINIYGAPGHGVDDIQRQVEQALENIERRRQARARSRLRDTE